MPTNNLPLALADTVTPVDRFERTSALVALYDRSVDSVKGYKTMVEKSEPAFREIAERFHALHAMHADRLGALLFDQGVMPESDGTVMGMVNQAAVSLRAFFDDIDEDVMDQVRSGEDWVLKAFDDAIAEQAGAGPVLQAMRTELTTLLADTRGLG